MHSNIMLKGVRGGDGKYDSSSAQRTFQQCKNKAFNKPSILQNLTFLENKLTPLLVKSYIILIVHCV